MARLTSRNEKGDLMLLGKQVYAGDFYEAVSALEEYEDAEEQERLLVLPCKIGDPVYHSFVRNCDGCPQTKYCEEEDLFPECQRLMVAERPFELEYLNGFGKSVFLTRKEAETALKQRLG